MKALFLLLFSFQVYAGGQPSVATSEFIDIQKYLGKWYAVSDIPQFFSRKCLYQTAEYGIKSEFEISVKNTCYTARKVKEIYGQAKVVNLQTNSELIVTFNTFWTRLFRVKGDYNIIKIDPNYEYVMVGGNDRSNLWIMSRRPNMPEDIYQEYTEFAQSLGFNINLLRRAKF